MAIYLIRHGHAKENPMSGQKELTEEGVQHTQKLIHLMKKIDTSFSGIYHSPVHRAFQTAKLIGDAFGLTIQEQEGLTPMDPPEIIAEQLGGWENKIIVSHNPFLSHLFSYLVSGDQYAGIYQFDTSCFCWLDNQIGQGENLWFARLILDPYLMPK